MAARARRKVWHGQVGVKASMIPKMSVMICLVAVLVSLILRCASTNFNASDVFISLIAVGPYALLALLAWRQRADPVASRILLGAVLMVAIWGLWVHIEDSYRYHSQPDYRRIQRMAIFFVPLQQWGVAILTGFMLWAAPQAYRWWQSNGNT